MATASSTPLLVQPRAVRLRQGAALLVGAGVLQLFVGSGSLSFFWTPLFVGFAYLAAALAGGRLGGYWATAVVFVPFGAVVAFLAENRDLNVRAQAAYIAALGLCALLGALLQRRGFGIDLFGVGGAILLLGLFYTLDRYWVEVLGKADTYAVLIALVGLWSIVAGLRADSGSTARAG